MITSLDKLFIHITLSSKTEVWGGRKLPSIGITQLPYFTNYQSNTEQSLVLILIVNYVASADVGL